MSDLLPKILIVDDRKENIYALESLLQSERVEILKAFSGREALELLLKHRFALALIDVQMPEISGFELAELMRGYNHTAEIPIIFVTAGAIDAKHTFQGYEAGAVDFLNKPLDPRIVKSKVRVFLRMEEQRLKIQTQMDQVTAALRVREEFLAIATHELKTPLASVSVRFQSALISLRTKDAAPSMEKLRSAFEIGNRQITKLVGLIDNLLDVSRMQTGQLLVHKAPIRLASTVRDVVDRLHTQLEQAACPIELFLDEDLIVPCELSRFEQVLVNLLSNATKYAPGFPISVQLRRHIDFAELVVTDRGPGISKDKIGHIFERFVRVGAQPGISGLGLGLYIVNQIMTAHGGNIHVTSEDNAGCTFIAKFPLLNEGEVALS